MLLCHQSPDPGAAAGTLWTLHFPADPALGKWQWTLQPRRVSGQAPGVQPTNHLCGVEPVWETTDLGWSVHPLRPPRVPACGHRGPAWHGWSPSFTSQGDGSI